MKPEGEPESAQTIHPLRNDVDREHLAPESKAPSSLENGQPEDRPIWAPELNADGTVRTDYTDLDLPDAAKSTESDAKAPKIPVGGPPGDGEFNTSARMSIGGKPVYVLPSGYVGAIEASEVFFADLGKMGELFVQGETVVEVAYDRKTGDGKLVRVTQSGLRSRLELLGELREYRKRGAGFTLESGAHCSEECAKALLASRAARTLLPRITLVVNCPIIMEEEAENEN
jgi:hypothetical protein